MSKYIDRDAFKDKYLCCGYLPEMSEEEFDAFSIVNGEFVRHGRWNGDICTNCGLPWDDLMVQNADDWGYFDPMPPFCPNCGAKMDLED